METDIQTILSQMTNDELDFLQKEILQIKSQRKRDKLRQIISEINPLLTKLNDLIGDTIMVYDFHNQVDAEIDLLDLVESLKGLI